MRLHLQQLQPDHLLISDMHHPAWQIRQLLSGAAQRVRMYPSNPILLSNRGKHEGAVWRDLRRSTGPVRHLGDNASADVSQALAYGHTAEHTSWALANGAEHAVLQFGAGDIARAARSARLICVAESPQQSGLATLQTAMCSIVFPVLALGALWLWQWVRARNARHIVFVGRDGATWQRVFNVLAPSMRTELLHASRTSLRAASEGMQAHFRMAVESGGVLADLCGSGASWAQFRDRSNIVIPALAHLIRYPLNYDVQGVQDLDTLVNAEELPPGSLHALETFCDGMHPRAVDAQVFRVGPLSYAAPVFAGSGLSDSSALAEHMQACLSTALEELSLEMSRARDELAMAALPPLMRQLLSELRSVSALADSTSEFSARNRLAA